MIKPWMLSRVRSAFSNSQRIQYPYQAWNYRYRTIFVHIPKCAGTSVVSCFERKTLPRTHAEWLKFYQADTEAFESFFKFTVVRHPLSRIVSAYFYIAKGGAGRPRDKKIQDYVLRSGASFGDFLKNVELDVLYQIHHFRPQWTYICDETGEVMMDFVGRVECLENAMGVVFSRLGVEELPIKFVNKTEYANKEYHFPQRIVDFYRRDFELFGYDATRLDG